MFDFGDKVDFLDRLGISGYDMSALVRDVLYRFSGWVSPNMSKSDANLFLTLPAGPTDATAASVAGTTILSFSDRPWGSYRLTASVYTKDGKLAQNVCWIVYSMINNGQAQSTSQNNPGVFAQNILVGRDIDISVNVPFDLRVAPIDRSLKEDVFVVWRLYPTMSYAENRPNRTSRFVNSIGAGLTVPSAVTDFIYPIGSDIMSNGEVAETINGCGWQPSRLFVIKFDANDDIGVKVAYAQASAPFTPTTVTYEMPVGTQQIEIQLDTSAQAGVKLTNNTPDVSSGVMLIYVKD